MNLKLAAHLTMIASLAFAMSACERGTKRAHGSAPIGKKPGPQKLDECPTADGKWNLNDGFSVEFGRKEGFLTLKQTELTEPVVMDGETRKIKETLSGLEVEVTGSCKDRLVQITQKQGKTSISQIWYIVAADGSLALDEDDGQNTIQKTGSRQAVAEQAAPAAAPETAK